MAACTAERVPMNQTNDFQPPAGNSVASQPGPVPPVQAPGAPFPPSRLKDLVGMRFGRLVVVGRAKNAADSACCWLTRCDCGNMRIVRGKSLANGDTRSCGCLRSEVSSSKKLKTFAGQVFGRLTVLSRAGAPGSPPKWNVLCSCGTTLTVFGGNLRRHNTMSCGCYHHDVITSLKGAKHPRWNPNLTEKDRYRRRLGTAVDTEMKPIRKAARARDRFRCVVCGASGCPLDVHHLEPWALDRELRYCLANLVTLCRECHEQFHELYGRDAGLEDFEEFLRETPLDSANSD